MPCTLKLALWNVAIMRFLCSARSPRETGILNTHGCLFKKERERCVSWFLPSRLGMDVIDSLVT